MLLLFLLLYFSSDAWSVFQVEAWDKIGAGFEIVFTGSNARMVLIDI